MWGKCRKYCVRNKEILILLLIFTLIKIFFIREFDNKDFEPDGYNHVLFANSLFVNFPKNLSLGLEVWAKPLFTYSYGFLSHMFDDKTLAFYQIINSLVWDVVSLCVYHIIKSNKAYKLWPIIGAVFCNICFLAFRDSVTALTEPIFALVIILSIFSLQRKNLLLATIFISLAPLGRIEGFLFVGIFCFFLLYKLVRKEISFVKFIGFGMIAITPAAIWDLLGYFQTGELLYLIKRGYPSQAGIYGYGSWFHYVRGFVDQDIFLLIFTILGVICIFYNIKKFVKIDYLILIMLYTLIFFLFNAYLWKHGLYGVAGLMRYFVSIIPLMAVIGGSGLNSLEMTKEFKYNYGVVFVLVIVITQLLYTYNIMFAKKYYDLQSTYPIPSPAWKDTGIWVKEHNITCEVLSTDPGPLYYAGKDMTNSSIYIDKININSQTDVLYILNDAALLSMGQSNLSNQYINIHIIKTFADYHIIFVDNFNDKGNCNLDL